MTALTKVVDSCSFLIADLLQAEWFSGMIVTYFLRFEGLFDRHRLV